jgi:hypothetical protein
MGEFKENESQICGKWDLWPMELENGCSNRKRSRSVPRITNSHRKWWSSGKAVETEKQPPHVLLKFLLT